MKINEIPEKIYLSYETDDEDYKDHIFIDYMWHRHPFEDKNLKNIEYVRADTFIKKALKFLDGGIPDYIELRHANVDTFMDVDNERFIKDFINHMKGE